MAQIPKAPTSFDSFEEFWPFYVSAHKRPLSRFLHYVGSIGALALLGLGIWTHQWWWFALAPVCGYGFAWIGHFGCEGNRPATFDFPLYSVRADGRMLWLGITGRMGDEVRRLGGPDVGC